MSASSPYTRAGRLLPALPRGEILGTYETYPEAQAVVDRLAKAEFPVNQVSIVGSGLKTVERVTGKLTWGRAAGAGAASGAWFGLFLGSVLLLFSAAPSLAGIGAAVLIGAGFGMAFGLASYAVNRRRHDFTSVNQVLASQYEVIVASELLVRGQELLARPFSDG
jgi:hypothetical protein